jgi:hypothetical protein
LETGIHLEFLIEHGNEKVLDSYQRASLAHDKKTLEKASSYKGSPYLPDDQALKAEILGAFSAQASHLVRLTRQKMPGEDRNTGMPLRRPRQSDQSLSTTSDSDMHHKCFTEPGLIWNNSIWFRDEMNTDRKLSYKRPTSSLLPAAASFCMTVASRYVVFMWAARKNPLVPAFARLGDWFHAMLGEHERFVSQAKKRRVN